MAASLDLFIYKKKKIIYIKRSRLIYHSKTGQTDLFQPFEIRTRPDFRSPLYYEYCEISIMNIMIIIKFEFHIWMKHSIQNIHPILDVHLSLLGSNDRWPLIVAV